MKKILLALCLLPLVALASTEVKLDSLPSTDERDRLPSLQHGVQLFVNYCLNCHSAAYMRYKRLNDIGLSDEQIKQNLMFTTDKVGNTMTIALNKKDAGDWLGAPPPDLTLVARVRGADWLYTYLRTFYRDDSKPSGWNNVAFPNVGMPHVLWQLQGIQVAEHGDKEGAEAHGPPILRLEKPGALSKTEYDLAVRDLVNYLVWMGEPVRESRVRIGIAVVLFLGVVLLPLAYLLKKEYWKDIH
jgi:ubiquinol-cytochrome c reductase cytochrome c1 subunit